MTGEGTNNLKSHAEKYAEIGWKIIPCHGIINGRCTCSKPHSEPKEVGKHPALYEWNVQATSEVEKVSSWWVENPNYNIGVHCSKSGLLVIDIDPRSGGPEAFAKFLEETGIQIPETVEAITGIYSTLEGDGGRGRHIFLKCDPEEGLIGNLGALGHKGVDIKHNGYVLIAPSYHFSSVNYEWVEGKSPFEIPVAEAPEELLSVLRKKSRASRRYTLSESDHSGELNELPEPDIEELLDKYLYEGERAVEVYRITCKYANALGTDPLARDAIVTRMIRYNAERIVPPLNLEGPGGLLMHVERAIDFVAENPKTPRPGAIAIEEWKKTAAGRMDEETARTSTRKPQSPASPSPLLGVVSPFLVPASGGDVAERVINSLASGASTEEATSLANIDVPLDPDAILEQDGGEISNRSLSDTGNGRRLVDSFGAVMRYTSGLGWFQYDGKGCWTSDSENLKIRELAKKIPPLVAQQVSKYPVEQQNEIIRWANLSRSNSRINAAIESAKSDPRVVVPVEQWDSDPYLIGVKNGIVNLKTGELMSGSHELFITRRAPIAYIPGQRNKRWENFLDQATGYDREFQDWLQRAAGYSLTGLNIYDIFFLVWGPPGSGKNTFVEALVKAIGTKQYAWPLDSGILGQGDINTSNTDLYHWAQLRGRRMVWVDELPEGERMKENAVKKLTGSSEISARSPGEQPFTFQSQAKLWVSTNHRPIITDDAMWRRIRPIPFDQVPERADPTLKDYIFDPEGALPAVFAWMVEGAIKLLNSKEQDALGWCTRVRDSAAMYRKNEDRIGLFLSEETISTPGINANIKQIYATYRQWSDSRGERALSQIAFQRKLSDRGIEMEGSGSRAVVVGVSLVPTVPSYGSGGLSQEDWTTLQAQAGF